MRTLSEHLNTIKVFLSNKERWERDWDNNRKTGYSSGSLMNELAGIWGAGSKKEYPAAYACVARAIMDLYGEEIKKSQLGTYGYQGLSQADWEPGDIVYATEGKRAINNTLSETTIKPKTLLSSVPYVPKGHNNAPTFAVKNKSLRIEFFDKREDVVAAALIAYGSHPDWETSIKYPYGISTQDKRDVVDFILRGVNPYASQRIWFLDKANPNFPLSWAKLIEAYPNCIGTYVLCLEDKGPQFVTNGLNEELIKENSLLRS